MTHNAESVAAAGVPAADVRYLRDLAEALESGATLHFPKANAATLRGIAARIDGSVSNIEEAE